jgi:hypothetical protein
MRGHYKMATYSTACTRYYLKIPVPNETFSSCQTDQHLWANAKDRQLGALRNSRTAFNAVLALIRTVCGATDTQGSLRYLEHTPAH